MKVRCPTCGGHEDVSEDSAWRPFCSRRCKMVDLGNWLDEVYRFSRPIGAADIDDDPAILSKLMAGLETRPASRR